MYKLLLCWRYLRTRYIALASIISVTLGVATLIVVNAVMAGFTHEMQDRIHGILSDVVLEANSLDGVPDAERHMRQIREVAGDQIAAMSPTVQVPAAMGYNVGDQYRTQPITLIGVDPATCDEVSDIGQYLQHPENRERLSFQLKGGGYDVYDHQAEDAKDLQPREEMRDAGWERRRRRAEYAQLIEPPTPAEGDQYGADPFANGNSALVQNEFDPKQDQHPGCIPGIALCSYRSGAGADRFLAAPGDDVQIILPSATRPPKFLNSNFTITDLYESKMSEYDGSFVFVSIHELQKQRGLIDPVTKVARFNSIQMRLKPGADPVAVRDKLREAFNPHYYNVVTWRDKQGPLLAAVDMERSLLNVLLSLIILVSGFGILAIFFMIVVEKTRDIGVLKSLGASGMGVMSIFLTYGLSLGIVGAGVGVVGGLVFVHYLEEIRALLDSHLGVAVFDPDVYYLPKIPAIIDPVTVTVIVIGAILIAVMASVLPALRAARLHPVQSLRWE